MIKDPNKTKKLLLKCKQCGNEFYDFGSETRQLVYCDKCFQVIT